MKHFLFKTIVGILLVFIVCSCGDPDYGQYDKETVPYTKESRFFVLPLPYDQEISDFQILVDKKTRIEYLFYRNGHQGGLTPLLDENGNITYYEGVTEYQILNK